MSKKSKASEEQEPEGAVTGEAAEGEGAEKKGKKKLVFIAAGVALVLAIAAGVFLSGMLGGPEKLDENGKPIVELSEEEQAAKDIAVAEANKPVYYELPEFLVNLNSTTGRVSFLKMSVTLELRDAAGVITMDANKPRVQDIFNTYLRELRPSDIQGSAGIYRLRTELLSRLNATMEDGLVKDILFGEIIVQ